MFKKILYNYRMRKLRKYYIDYTMKQNICNYIVKGIQ